MVTDFCQWFFIKANKIEEVRKDCVNILHDVLDLPHRDDETGRTVLGLLL